MHRDHSSDASPSCPHRAYLHTALALVAIAALAVTFLWIAADDAEASHLRGGSLFYEPTGNENEVRFMGTVAYRWSYFGNPPIGSIPTSITINTGDAGLQGGSISANLRVDIVDSNEDWFVGTIVDRNGNDGVTYTYSGPSQPVTGDPWQASFSTSARVGTSPPNDHMNNPNSDFYLTTDIKLDNETASPNDPVTYMENESPKVFVPPIYTCSPQPMPPTIPGVECEVPILMTDGNPTDQANLTLRFSTSAEAFGPGTTATFNQPGDPGFGQTAGAGPYASPNTWAKLDPAREALLWAVADPNDPSREQVTRSTSQPNSLYSAQIMVEDGKTKAPIDFMIKIAIPDAPYWDLPLTPCDKVVEMPWGRTSTFTVRALYDETRFTGRNAGKPIEMFISPTTPLPPGATSPMPTPAPNKVESVFTWTPPPSELDNEYILGYFAHIFSDYAPVCKITVRVVSPPPIADFSCATIASNDPYGRIRLTDLSFGDVDLYEWDMDSDGNRDYYYGFDPNPPNPPGMTGSSPLPDYDGAHPGEWKYDKTGVYRVRLTTTTYDAEDRVFGVSTKTHDCRVTVNHPPGMNVLRDEWSVYEGEEVRFQVKGFDPDGDVVQYHYDAGPDLPPQATYDTDTNVFYWKTTKGDADGGRNGVYKDITFWVSDYEFESTRQDVTIIVLKRPTQPGPVPEGDGDGDGAADGSDNCPGHINPDQADSDGDGVGDRCDPTPNPGDGDDPVDEDGDPIVPPREPLPQDQGNGQNPEQADSDKDGVVDVEDNCVTVRNDDQSDVDGDGIGDACDPNDDRPAKDTDNDGIYDTEDVCPMVPDAGQEDLDGDGIGDACDSDTDGDGVPNNMDLCPTVRDPAQLDLDLDRIGDACDPDIDGDGVLDADPSAPDNCPYFSNSDQEDTDGDGIGDACQGDLDRDGTDDAVERATDDRCFIVPDSNGDGACDDQDPAATTYGLAQRFGAILDGAESGANTGGSEDTGTKTTDTQTGPGGNGSVWPWIALSVAVVAVAGGGGFWFWRRRA